MSKSLLVVMLAFTILVGCTNDIETVKSGVLNFNKTITIGNALDRWQSCKYQWWQEFESDSGIRVVEFVCDHEISRYFNKIKSFLPDEEKAKSDHLNVLSIVQTFQFTLNLDGTFQVNSVFSEFAWLDGSRQEVSYEEVADKLEDAYDNVTLFDPKEVTDESSTEGVSSLFSYLKAGLL